MLEKATRLIREHASWDPENGSSKYGAEAIAVNRWETDERALENFRNLFQPNTARARSTSFSSSSRQQSASSAPATKRRKQNTTVLFFKRDTWTHEFFCPANKEQMVVCSRSFNHHLNPVATGWSRPPKNLLQQQGQRNGSQDEARGELL